MSSNNLRIFYVTIVICLFLSSILYAEGKLTIKPGKYKITKTTKTNFDTEAATKTEEECITEPDLDPESILPSKKDCKIQNMKSSENKASFDFMCNEPGEKSALKGRAEYSTEGTTVTYQFKLEGSFKGRELIVDSEGTGVRIGDCVPEPEFNY